MLHYETYRNVYEVKINPFSTIGLLRQSYLTTSPIFTIKCMLLRLLWKLTALMLKHPSNCETLLDKCPTCDVIVVWSVVGPVLPLDVGP